MKRGFFLIFLVSTVWGGLAYAGSNKPIDVSSGILTGNSFRELGHNEKIGYAMGFLDGVYVSPLVGAPPPGLQWIEKCTTGMTSTQLLAILNKYLGENPASWHLPMNILALGAFKENCNY